MPDVLTHVLAGYILGMLVAVRSEWIRAPQVTLVMLGALSPDIMKIALLVPAVTVESVLGMPFSCSRCTPSAATWSSSPS